MFPCVALLLNPQSAYAYVDPGTGSLAIQAILGFVFAGLLLIKTYWHRLKWLVKRPFQSRQETADDGAQR